MDEEEATTEALEEEIDELEDDLDAEVEALSQLFTEQETRIAELEAEVAGLRSGGGEEQPEPSDEPGPAEEEARAAVIEPEPGGEPVVTIDERPPKPTGFIWRRFGDNRIETDSQREKALPWHKRPIG